jgi:hypothetical protein
MLLHTSLSPQGIQHRHNSANPILTDALAPAAAKGQVLEVMGGFVWGRRLNREAIRVEHIWLLPQRWRPAASGGSE